jgi:hypothetical protein
MVMAPVVATIKATVMSAGMTIRASLVEPARPRRDESETERRRESRTTQRKADTPLSTT